MKEEVLYAYLAGAIDADGYISIQRSKPKRYNHYYYCAMIGFTGTGEPLVQNILKKTFGGGVYRYQPKNPKHKPWHQWQTSGSNKVYLALEKLMPYLITKKEQARIVLRFIDLLRPQWQEIKETQKPPYRVTPEMLEKRAVFWAKVVSLNAPRNKTGAKREAEELLARVGKKAAGNLLDGRTWQEFPVRSLGAGAVTAETKER